MNLNDFESFFTKQGTVKNRQSINMDINNALVSIQNNINCHSGELLMVARYRHPGCHSNHWPLNQSDLAIIPESCQLLVPKKNQINRNEGLFDLASKSRLVIPISRFVTIQPKNDGDEYIYVCQRHDQPLCLTCEELNHAGHIHRDNAVYPWYGDRTCQIIIGYNQLSHWLMSNGTTYHTRLGSYYSRFCDACELLGIPLEEMDKIVDWSFWSSFSVHDPTGYQIYADRYSIPSNQLHS